MPYIASYPLVKYLLTKESKVLDFGCGAGGFLQEVGELIGEGVGVDLSSTGGSRGAEGDVPTS